MCTPIFQGAATALITPMKPDGSIHYKAMEQLVDYQLSHHIDGLVVAGTTGEAPTLSKEEYQTLVTRVVDQVKGAVPVIAGAGTNHTGHSIDLAKTAWKAGANALLCVTPYYNKTSQQGLIAHFQAVSEATPLPVMLYNIPSRTGMNILPETCLALCDNPKIVAIKEAGVSLTQAQRTLALCGDRLDLYSGNDDLLLPLLAVGAKGVISVLSNLLPETVHRLCYSFWEGDPEESRRLQMEHLELMEALFADVNPIPVKQALKWMGLKAGPCRSPLFPMEKNAKKRLRRAMEERGLLSQNFFSPKGKTAPNPNHGGTGQVRNL